MWLKYKIRWGNGPDEEWTWIDLEAHGYAVNSNPDLIEDFVNEEIKSKHNSYDLYRGVDYLIVEFPPLDILEDFIFMANKRLKSANSTIQRYMTLKSSLPSENKPRRSDFYDCNNCEDKGYIVDASDEKYRCDYCKD